MFDYRYKDQNGGVDRKKQGTLNQENNSGEW